MSSLNTTDKISKMLERNIQNIPRISFLQNTYIFVCGLHLHIFSVFLRVQRLVLDSGRFLTPYKLFLIKYSALVSEIEQDILQSMAIPMIYFI